MYYHVYVGGYSSDTDAQSIRLYSCSGDSGKLRLEDVAGAHVNPSFLTVTSERLYALSEQTGKGFLDAYIRDRVSGRLTYMNSQPIAGSAMCHVFMWPDRRHISTAQYLSGDLTVCALSDQGAMERVARVVAHHGVGFDAKGRQEGPHLHATAVDHTGKRLLAADLGLDMLACYQIQLDGGEVSLRGNAPIRTPDGFGPRHFVFSADGQFLYVVGELANQIAVYQYHAANGTASFIQLAEMLPSDYHGENLAAGICISATGKTLYASNRGHDSIVAFHVDPQCGTLKRIQFVPSCGQWPRHFAITPDRRHLLIANQNGGSVVVRKLDTSSEEIGAVTDSVPVPQASFVTSI